ncbi:ABC transporter ATP-binding protein [Caldicellulosiruptor changbaiensis]|uniref:ABC transporter ATP-binding protein n=1 Tax=Caldicellulosiruptor changbaiensis TaxID=1222016 RepID=A0A3T0D3Q1_9FIRM|nr:ABC transporter ATP-binding protein [Caldicellulosiruptor changbaiensis]AZT89330.1 ABC transporter ATP-binding protein [Caldicellulosiruptor changbaiensis]
MSKAVEVISVYKRFGKKEVIKGVSFDIDEGETVGFVGPNGAGKTTTIKMMTGLIRPTDGQIKIFGHDVVKEPLNAMRYVGCIVEKPEVYEFLTGFENMAQIARIYRIGKEKIYEAAKFVGIDYALKEKAKKYSLGMKQRLALAMAILTEPKLLILDEPTNGLDPSGIIELRNLLRSLSKDKKTTIFISSHNLNEIEEICEKVIFIKDGKIEMVKKLTQKGENGCKRFVVVLNTDNLEVSQITKIIEKFNQVKVVSTDSDKIEVELLGDKKMDFLNFLFQNNVSVRDFYEKTENLESVYLKIYSGEVLSNERSY